MLDQISPSPSFEVLNTLVSFDSLSTCKAGAQVDDPVQQEFNGQEMEVWSRIVWKPKWGLTFADVKSKVRGSTSITQKSTMILKGRDIFIEGLSLDGTLVLDAVDGVEVKAGGSVQNKGWMLESVDYRDASVAEETRIRGFKINKIEQLEKNYTEPGKYELKP